MKPQPLGNIVRPRRAGALVAALLCAAAAASPGQTSTRVLSRDAGQGGPAGVSLDDLGPLFDGDLASALEELDRGRTARAIEELSAFLDSNASSPLADEALVALGYAYHTAGQHRRAVETLAHCPDAAPLFADHCAYWAALSSLELGEASAAAVFAATVDPDTVFGPRARFARGRALAVAGRDDDAVEVFEAFLVDHPDASYRNDVEFALAASYRAAGRLDDAGVVYRRVALLNPGSEAETDAERELEAMGASLPASSRARAPRSRHESLERAQVLFDRHRSEQVIAALEPVVRDEPVGTETFCEATYLIGRSYTKLRDHASALGPYLRVVEHCEAEDVRVRALYNGGRAAWNADEDAQAHRLFERLWTEHAQNSHADDAYLLAARVALSNGETARAETLLREQIDRYPAGDMLGEAVWLLAQRSYDAGDFRAVIRFVDEQGSRTGEADGYSRGRLAYFRGRSLEQLSLRTEARQAFTAVVRANPMSYYALLALTRLNGLDAAAAAALVEEVRAPGPEASGFIEIRPAEAARDPFFRRGTTLLRMGLLSLAELEFNKVERNYANNEEIAWVMRLLYHRVGAFERSHRSHGADDLRLSYPNATNLERWQIAYPMPFTEVVDGAAAARSIDRAWIYAIMRSESGFRPDIESWANARGLLQLMEGTANDMARLTGRGSVRARELFDPAINVELGVMYMRTLADRFGNHPFLVFGGYNGGAGNVNSWLRARRQLPLDQWVEAIPFDQTRNYVKGVGTSYWVYAWLYDDHPIPTLPFDLSGI